MTSLTQRMHNINQPEFSPGFFVNDSFWNLLVLASLMLATLVGIQQLM
jgi:hypothetical protein